LCSAFAALVGFIERCARRGERQPNTADPIGMKSITMQRRVGSDDPLLGEPSVVALDG
jgi:hypothetical protein